MTLEFGPSELLVSVFVVILSIAAALRKLSPFLKWWSPGNGIRKNGPDPRPCPITDNTEMKLLSREKRDQLKEINGKLGKVCELLNEQRTDHKVMLAELGHLKERE